MMKKIPICLNIDDCTACIHVWYEHHGDPQKRTTYGTPVLPRIPNSFMKRFCEIVTKYHAGGKLSVVPLPGGKNPFDTPEGQEWLSLLHTYLEGHFSFGPEMLTHAAAYDLKNQCWLPMNEHDWSQTQDEETLTAYIENAVRTLCSRGVTPSGVTSPWQFGCNIEKTYQKAISNAYHNVLGIDEAWYFLFHNDTGKPELVLNENGRKVWSVCASENDGFWQTLNTPRHDEAYIREIADNYITDNGKDGLLVRHIAAGAEPVILAHWQSLFSNGLETGLSALELVLERIDRNLSDRVEFVSYEEKIRRYAAENNL